jgi:hypothetical protein
MTHDHLRDPERNARSLDRQREAVQPLPIGALRQGDTAILPWHPLPAEICGLWNDDNLGLYVWWRSTLAEGITWSPGEHALVDRVSHGAATGYQPPDTLVGRYIAHADDEQVLPAPAADDLDDALAALRAKLEGAGN